MRFLPILVVAMAAALVPPPEASAQRFPGRDRGGSPRDDAGSRDRDRSRAAPAIASDPFAALERELISLKVDIQLKADQVEAWSLFERDVRSAAEVDRAQRRRLLALRDAGSPPPTALSVVTALAEDDRLKADAVADLQRDLQALYDKLDEGQRQMLDRRVAQSQTEPLGR